MKFLVVALALCSPLAFAAAPTSDQADAPQGLDGIRAKYVASASQSENDIRTFIKNGGSCGFIGGIMVGKMGDAEKGQAKARQDIDKLLAAVAGGDSSKRAAAKSRIEQELAALKDSRQQVESNLSTIQNALSTDSPTCKTANHAFFDIQTQNKIMTAQLMSARQLLGGKQAELIDGIDYLDEAYGLPMDSEEIEIQTIQTSSLN